MRHWAPFVAAYAAIAVLVLAGSPLAQETTETAPPETVEAVTTAEAPPPVTTETVPAETVPAAPAPVETVPVTPVAPAAEPEPEPKPKRKKPVARAAADGSVTIADFAFAPNSVTVNVGDSVTWANEDDVAHTATADDGSFDTGNIENGQSRSVTFDEAGTFAYFCKPHPNMRGTVVVEASGAEGGAGGDEGGGGESDDSGAAAGDTGSSTGSTDSAASGDTLPATGADDVLLLSLLGMAMLALGFVTRGRAAEPAPRLPGRRGW
jgi:LPXTG-motif cell wall-anchored protein